MSRRCRRSFDRLVPIFGICPRRECPSIPTPISKSVTLVLPMRVSSIRDRRFRSPAPLSFVVPLVAFISRIPTDRAVSELAPANCAPLTGLAGGKPTLLRELGPSNVPPARRRSTLTPAARPSSSLARVPGRRQQISGVASRVPGGGFWRSFRLGSRSPEP